MILREGKLYYLGDKVVIESSKVDAKPQYGEHEEVEIQDEEEGEDAWLCGGHVRYLFKRALITARFAQSAHGYSLFPLNKPEGMVIVLVYMDDLLITDDNKSMISESKEELHRKYILELISETGLVGAKLVFTPMDPNVKLTSVEYDKATGCTADVVLKDATLYQRLVGKLMYATITKPNIKLTWPEGLFKELNVPISKPISLFSETDPNPTYKNELDDFVVAIDKDHFSLVKFLSYTNDLEYTKVKEFYCQHIDGGDLVQITNDRQLLDFVKDLRQSDEGDVFVEHVIGDHLQKIPIGFLKYLKGHDHIEHVVLKRAGNKWLVKMNGRRLEDGWEKFAEEHDLQLGDMLIFRHEGDMEFDVSIFDSTHCVTKYVEYMQIVEEKDKKVEDKNEDDEVVEDENDEEDEDDEAYTHDKPFGQSHFEFTIRQYCLSKGKTFSNVEAVKDANLSHSHFICTIKPYCLSKHFVYLPMDFAKSNGLMDKHEMIIVDEKRRSWSVWIGRIDEFHFGIKRGWTQFRKENGVQVGDTYRFELTNNGTIPVVHFLFLLLILIAGWLQHFSLVDIIWLCSEAIEICVD
ncbi:hypothetical protein CQW23_18837 [Capsicum baccatum]|uniref:TF-B3 domain-containing protein n=1 Tax=Capsicum baccatum TaxID=33114 RepID=A0A2G2W450_CAPBA|nr:hypothetical protein CQW23_18837 [Capsicum baccatum]